MNSIESEKSAGGPYGDLIEELPREQFPFLLKQACETMERPPDRLYIRGALPPDSSVFLAVVGSRKATDYGKAACESLIAGLRGLPVVIVSGLAYGIDSIAHEAALQNGLPTIAIPGSGLADEAIYPAAGLGLARRILESGGCLVSPFEATTMGNDWTFPYRNSIMAAMSNAVLVIEAAEKSGTLITANRALSFDRDVFVVPGSIFSEKSRCPLGFLKDGARPITSGADLAAALGLDPAAPRALDVRDLDPLEREMMDMLEEPIAPDMLARKLGRSAASTSAIVSALEMKGLVETVGNRLQKRQS